MTSVFDRWHLLTRGRVRRLPLLIYYPTERCNLKCASCSYGGVSENKGELSLKEISALADDCRDLGTITVMLSGGEPLLREDLPEIARCFKNRGMKLILLTNGTYLSKRSLLIKGLFDECYVSLDGPTAEVHNFLRGADSFELILEGLAKFQLENPLVPVTWRMVVQKNNFRLLRRMAQLAVQQGARYVSFLAVDVSSGAFGRDLTGRLIDASRHVLNPNEIIEFRQEINLLYQEENLASMVLESRHKMLLMADYFERLHNQMPLLSPPCTAPMVSLVIDSRGNVLPCFFLEAQSNVRTTPLKEILNSFHLRRVRRHRQLKILKRCQGCVCSLNASAKSFGFNKSHAQTA